uniref:Fibronectin type-III domain-containing protein n=1 Tax=Macrostomum lignano TaxID=282301 RepID=A0A1I8HM46_9PLAT
SGQEYELRVAVQKAGGFDDVITALSNQLTKDSVAPAVSGLTILLIPGGPVRLSWKPLSPELGRGVVFEFELRLDGPGGCAAARRLNCSDCGRHRLQLQSEEARQRLEALTADCSAPVLVRAFEFGDASLSAEVAVSSEGASPRSLLPWTEYGASLWPVNLAGPGAVASASFRSPETRSGAVGGLRATPSEAEALVEFEEPRLPNGLLQAFAVHVFNVASNVCSQLLVLNSTNAGCQLPSCTTGGFLDLLSRTCASTQYVNNSGNGSDAYAVRVRQLQPGTEYSVRVTPVSQTLAGDSAELNFVTAGGDGGGGAATIVVAVAVPLVVILAIVAASLIFLRIRRQNRSPQKAAKPASDSPAGSGVSGAPNDYATVVGGSAQSAEYVEIPAVNGRR